MNLPLPLVLLLLGHTLGDFYFQWDAMARNKCTDWRYMAGHALFYAGPMAAALFGGMVYKPALWWVFGIAAASHAIIDCLKSFITKRRDAPHTHRIRVAFGRLTARISRKIFIIDQLVHLAVLLALYFAWHQQLTVVPALESFRIPLLPGNPLVVLLALLCLLRPVGCLIGSGEIWNSDKGKEPTEASEDICPTDSDVNEARKGAGKMIGYLERLIVFFLLLNDQFTPIAFVIAAKSVIRFPEISSGKSPGAEYYLIGTLLSMACAFIITFLLGLIP